MKKYRFVYMCECFVDADTEDDARAEFSSMPDDELKRKSDFVDLVAVEADDI